jgi:hypothetical protein
MAAIGKKRRPSAGTVEAGGIVATIGIVANGGMTVTATAGVITMSDGNNRFIPEK